MAIFLGWFPESNAPHSTSRDMRSWSNSYRSMIGMYMYIPSIRIWLVEKIQSPLKNDGVRQLGWWHSQYGKINNVPNHYSIYIYIYYIYIYIYIYDPPSATITPTWFHGSKAPTRRYLLCNRGRRFGRSKKQIPQMDGFCGFLGVPLWPRWLVSGKIPI